MSDGERLLLHVNEHVECFLTRFLTFEADSAKHKQVDLCECSITSGVVRPPLTGLLIFSGENYHSSLSKTKALPKFFGWELWLFILAIHHDWCIGRLIVIQFVPGVHEREVDPFVVLIFSIKAVGWILIIFESADLKHVAIIDRN